MKQSLVESEMNQSSVKQTSFIRFDTSENVTLDEQASEMANHPVWRISGGLATMWVIERTKSGFVFLMGTGCSHGIFRVTSREFCRSIVPKARRTFFTTSSCMVVW
jgi:hypothetical protein